MLTEYEEQYIYENILNLNDIDSNNDNKSLNEHPTYSLSSRQVSSPNYNVQNFQKQSDLALGYEVDRRDNENILKNTNGLTQPNQVEFNSSINYQLPINKTNKNNNCYNTGGYIKNNTNMIDNNNNTNFFNDYPNNSYNVNVPYNQNFIQNNANGFVTETPTQYIHQQYYPKPSECLPKTQLDVSKTLGTLEQTPSQNTEALAPPVKINILSNRNKIENVRPRAKRFKQNETDYERFQNDFISNNLKLSSTSLLRENSEEKDKSQPVKRRRGRPKGTKNKKTDDKPKPQPKTKQSSKKCSTELSQEEKDCGLLKERLINLCIHRIEKIHNDCQNLNMPHYMRLIHELYMLRLALQELRQPNFIKLPQFIFENTSLEDFFRQYQPNSPELGNGFTMRQYPNQNQQYQLHAMNPMAQQNTTMHRDNQYEQSQANFSGINNQENQQRYGNNNLCNNPQFMQYPNNYGVGSANNVPYNFQDPSSYSYPYSMNQDLAANINGETSANICNKSVVSANIEQTLETYMVPSVLESSNSHTRETEPQPININELPNVPIIQSSIILTDIIGELAANNSKVDTVVNLEDVHPKVIPNYNRDMPSLDDMLESELETSTINENTNDADNFFDFQQLVEYSNKDNSKNIFDELNITSSNVVDKIPKENDEISFIKTIEVQSTTGVEKENNEKFELVEEQINQSFLDILGDLEITNDSDIQIKSNKNISNGEQIVEEPIPATDNEVLDNNDSHTHVTNIPEQNSHEEISDESCLIIDHNMDDMFDSDCEESPENITIHDNVLVQGENIVDDGNEPAGHVLLENSTENEEQQEHEEDSGVESYDLVEEKGNNCDTIIIDNNKENKEIEHTGDSILNSSPSKVNAKEVDDITKISLPETLPTDLNKVIEIESNKSDFIVNEQNCIEKSTFKDFSSQSDKEQNEIIIDETSKFEEQSELDYEYDNTYEEVDDEDDDDLISLRAESILGSPNAYSSTSFINVQPKQDIFKENGINRLNNKVCKTKNKCPIVYEAETTNKLKSDVTKNCSEEKISSEFKVPKIPPLMQTNLYKINTSELSGNVPFSNANRVKNNNSNSIDFYSNGLRGSSNNIGFTKTDGGKIVINQKCGQVESNSHLNSEALRATASVSYNNLDRGTRNVSCTNLKSGGIFGTPCFKYLNKECTTKNCKYSHSVLNPTIVKYRLENLNSEELCNIFQFALTCRPILILYHNELIQLLIQRKKFNQLTDLILYCGSHPQFFQIIPKIYTFMVENGETKLNSANIIFNIFKRKGLDIYDNRLINYIVDILFNADWTQCLAIINEIACIDKYQFKSRTIIEMADYCNLSKSNMRANKILLKCIIKNKSDIVTSQSAEVKQFLEHIQRCSMFI